MTCNHRIPFPRAVLVLVLLLATSLAGAGAPAIADDRSQPPGPPPSPARDRVIDGIKQNFERLGHIGTVSLSYRLRYANLLGKRNYAFDEVRVRNISRGDMLRTEIDATMSRTRSSVVVHRGSTWNTKYGMQQIDDGSIIITDAIGNYAHHYRYYFDFLCLPIGSARLRGKLKATTIAEGGDYWIPDALIRLAGEYRVASDPESIDGVPCTVLERPGRDRLWVDPARDYAVLRRDFWYPGGQQLWERTIYRNHEQVGGYWFPTLIEREEFGRPDQPRDLANKVCHRKTIDQVVVSTEPAADELFALPIPEGKRVDDRIRQVRYTALAPGGGEALIAKAVAETKRLNPPSHRLLWLVLANGLLVVVLAVVILVRRAATRSLPVGAAPEPVEDLSPQEALAPTSRSPSTIRGWVVGLIVASSLVVLTVALALSRTRHQPGPPRSWIAEGAHSLDKTIQYERAALHRLNREITRTQDPSTAKVLKQAYGEAKKSLESHLQELSALGQ